MEDGYISWEDTGMFKIDEIVDQMSEDRDQEQYEAEQAERQENFCN